jgi:hypothetical protein
MRSLAQDLGVTTATIRRALAARYTEPVVKARLAAARIEGGHAMSDRAIERAQNITDKDDAAAARVEVGAFQWTAERWNRDQYGQRPQTAVQVNMGLGALHLEALRRRAAADRALEALPAEVISITDGDASAPELADTPARSLEAGNRADTLVSDEG